MIETGVLSTEISTAHKTVQAKEVDCNVPPTDDGMADAGSSDTDDSMQAEDDVDADDTGREPVSKKDEVLRATDDMFQHVSRKKTCFNLRNCVLHPRALRISMCQLVLYCVTAVIATRYGSVISSSAITNESTGIAGTVSVARQFTTTSATQPGTVNTNRSAKKKPLKSRGNGFHRE